MNAAGTALIERLIPAVEAGIHAADDIALQEEADRYDALPPSPVVLRIREFVAGEQAQRATVRLVRAGAVASC